MTFFNRNLPPKLADIQENIKGYAKDYGLDFFETIFEVCKYDEINMVAAYGGFPTRYPHWRFGMEYDQLSKSYTYGLSKIYEMVINNDPCYAYLLQSNALVDQKIVIAHVYGHCDFFKNNYFFAHTNRKMVDEMANHATRVRKYMDKYGVEKVESFIDTCLSLENLIDYYSPFIKRHRAEVEEDDNDEKIDVKKFKVNKEYMSNYVNPKNFLDKQKEVLKQEKLRKEMVRKFPEEPEKDVLLFLQENAPMKKWQSDILSIIREESYYFAPQGQTKIMNEGWASFWHSKIMTTKALDDSEVIDYADHHSGTLGTSPGRINPYKLGIELFRHIEDRWNKGRFGKEYRECENMAVRNNWNTHLNKGREKIFEVRKYYNDVTFIDEFLTEEFCREYKLFTYGYHEKSKNWVIESRKFQIIKNKLLHSLTNFGQPIIYVENANYENRGELLLVHQHEGVDLKTDYACDTLRNIYTIWSRPVNILTQLGDDKSIITFDGKEVKQNKVS